MGAKLNVEGNAWLCGLSAPDLDALRPRLQDHALHLGDVLQAAHEPAQWVYFPVQGLLSLVYTSLDGATVETGMVGQEGASGLQEACSGAAVYVNHLVQIEGRALRAPASACRTLHETSPTFRQAVGASADLLLNEARQSVVCQALHSAEARFARWLLESRDRAACAETVPLTQEHLAAMLGVQRTTISAVASTLQKAGLVRYSRGRIVLLDPAGLERIACECRSAMRRYRENAERS